MNAASTSIEQQARITQVNGNVQLIRDGFFLPAQAGMVLLPGDRVLSDAGGKAVIEFTGVQDALIIENGAAATFNLEVVEMDQAPQWIATDLYGEGVYFDGQQTTGKTASTTEDAPDLFGLFGTTSASGESTGFPVLESLVFLGATAAIYSDNEDNPNTTETTSTTESGNNDSGTGGNNNPPPAPPPETEEPAPGPLDAVLDPVTNALDGLLSTLGAPSPVGSLPLPLQANSNVANLPTE